MAGGKTFKRDQKRRKEMARKLKQQEKMKKRLERKKQGASSLDDLIDFEGAPAAPDPEDVL